MGARHLLQALQAAAVAPVAVGPAVEVEAQLGIVELGHRRVGHLPQQPMAGGPVVGVCQLEQLLVGGDEPLPLADLDVEGGQGGQAGPVLGVDLDRPLVGRDGPARVVEPIPQQLADLEGLPGLGGGIVLEEELLFGHRHHPGPIRAGLGQPPQAGVGRQAAGVHLLDDLLEGGHRLAADVELLLEDAGPLEGQGHRPLAVGGQGDAPLEDRDERPPVPVAGVDLGERGQRLAVAGGRPQQILPGPLGPVGVGEGLPRQPGQPPQARRPGGGVLAELCDLGLQHPGQLLRAAELLVSGGQGVEGGRVSGGQLEDLLPPVGGPLDVADAVLDEIGDPQHHAQLLVGRRDVAQVVLQRLHQAPGIFAPLEDALEPFQRLPVPRGQLEDLGRRPGPFAEIGEPVLIEAEQPAQQGQLLRLGRGVFDLPPQQLGQIGPALFPLEQLGQRPQPHRVAGLDGQDLAVDADRPLAVAQLLEQDARQPSQAVDLLGGVGGGVGLPLEQGSHPIPLLVLLQEPLLGLPGPHVPGVELLHPLPGLQGPVAVPQVSLGDDGDLLQPFEQLGQGTPGPPGVLEGEVQQLDQRLPVAPLPEVLGVGLERLGVGGALLEDGVPVDRGLLGVTEPLAVELGQLGEDGEAELGRLDVRKLLLPELGQPGPVLFRRVELDQPLRGGAPRRLHLGDLLVDAQGLFGIAAIALGELGPLEEKVHLLIQVARLRRPFPVVEIEIGEAGRPVEDVFDQLGGGGVSGHRRQGLAEGRDGVLQVPGLVAPAGDLVVDGRRLLLAVGPQPGRVGVHRRQGLERPIVPGAQPHHLSQPLGRPLQIAEPLSQDPPQPQQEVAAPLGLRGQGQLELVQLHHRGEVAEGPVDLARRLHQLERLGRHLGLALGGRQRRRPLQLAEALLAELPQLAVQVGDAGGVPAARQGRGLQLQHRHVFTVAGLLPVEVFEALGGLQVLGVAVDGVGQVGLGALRVVHVVEPDLARQIKQLAGPGAVLERLRPQLVQGDELVPGL